MNKKGKTLEESLPELEKIAKDIGVKINNFVVITEYFRRHPN